MKLNGFGVSVIQRLCKTSVKKNLYWEIKDKVVEEAFNGIRSVKRSQKVREFGLNSTKEIRARLIEILYDRVALHKDKFVAPILHSEMQSMEVKKNGKVEHSQNSHDDQVFSYLMALYVWYDGKNLAENFHIVKNTIKTDQDEDFESLEIDDSIEATEKVDVDSDIYDEESDIGRTLAFVEKNMRFITTTDLRGTQYSTDMEKRDMLLATNKDAREAYCKETGLDPSMFAGNGSTVYVELPDALFTDDEVMFDDNDDYYGQRHQVLQGNLADWWNKV